MKNNEVLLLAGGFLVALLLIFGLPSSTPNPNPDPDFPEPVGVFANVPKASNYISGKEAGELAWFWKNFAEQIASDVEISHVDMVRNMHVYAGKTLRRLLGESVYSKDLSDSFERFFDETVGRSNVSLDTQKRKEIVNAFMAIAWSCKQAAGKSTFSNENGVVVCDPITGSCIFDETELACYTALLEVKNRSHFFQIGPKVPQQTKPIDNSGLLFNEEESQEFLKKIPDFKQFGFSGFEEGGKRLLYTSLLKFDPTAFTERQETGDCFIAWRNNMNLPGTKVRMSDGSEKAIEDVRPGEYVLNAHNELSEVVTSFKKPFSGTLYEIKLQGLVDPVVCTPDHKFLTSYRGEESWVAAEELSKNTHILVPFASLPESSLVVDMQGLTLAYTNIGVRNITPKAGYVRVKGGKHPINSSVIPKPIPMSGYGLEMKVSQISTHEVEDIEVYCIEVPNHNSFIANGVAVHNCVSHSTRNACDVSRAFEIDVGHENESFVCRGATEPIYGTRGHAGQGMSVVGSVKFVSDNGGVLLRKKYGDYDLSKYSPKIGIAWGWDRSGTPQEIKDAGKEHQIKQVAHITSTKDAAEAIYNGYALTVGSNYSFSSVRDENGVARRTPQGWAHAMAWVAVATADELFSEEGLQKYIKNGYDVVEAITGEVPKNLTPRAAKDPCFLIVNSWGNWNSGPEGKFDIPDGAFWITGDIAKGMIQQQQAFALGNFNGFDPLPIDDWGFKPWLGTKSVDFFHLEPFYHELVE